MKYIKFFNLHNDYNTYINSQNKELPNVSYCKDNNEVHYTPFVRNDIIEYKAILKVTIDDNKFNTTIKSHTFLNSIGRIEFNNDVTEIKAYAFNILPISEITLPSTITSIGTSAFSGSLLSKIILPESITSIGVSAFLGCRALSLIVVKSVIPPSLSPTAPDVYTTFDNNLSGRKIYVPTESVNTYKTTTGWSNYAADIESITNED